MSTTTTTLSPFVPGLAGVPAAQSAVSSIDGELGILEYRGTRIEELAEKSTFEETAFLLLFGHLPTQAELEAFDHELKARRAVTHHVTDFLKSLPAGGHPMNVLQASVSALGVVYGAPNVEDPAVRRETALRLIAAFPSLVGAFHRLRQGKEPLVPRQDLSHAASFLHLLTGQEPDPVSARVLDVCLILHADHTLNASTFTARVVGSTLADGCSVMAAAVGSLSGPLHGGANEGVLDMLEEIGAPGGVRPFMEGKLARKEKIMGLGHRVYKVKDPRAHVLQRLAGQLFERFGTSPYYDTACAVEQVAEDLLASKGICPNVDFYSGIVYDRMGLPRDLFTTVFAVSRIAGWCAHWLEQLEDNRIYRPRQVYTGGHNVPYVALDQRG